MSDNRRIEYSYGSIKDSPCKRDCPDRSGECRLTCKKFAEYTKFREAKDKEISKKKLHELDLANYRRAIAESKRKRRNW